MFTGIIEELGRVKDISSGSERIKLSIECSAILEDVKIGDSIAVNGICLTVTNLGSSWFTADVMPETMRKTNLGCLKAAQAVNLERALRLSDRLGGHVVTGHIDGTGSIIGIKDEGNARWLTIAVPQDILKYVVVKGSIALDGTSLTAARVTEADFSVSLIPLTRGITTLGSKRAGDVINIECDILGKYIEKLLSARGSADSKPEDISIGFLRENGFV